MSEHVLKTQIRSAIRSLRRNRQRRKLQRVAGIGLLAFVVVGTFAVFGANYTKDENRNIGEARGIHVPYSMPAFPPLIAPAEAPEKFKAPLPGLLDLGNHYDDGYKSHRPDDTSNQSQNKEPQKASIVILDDLRAAPPKSMFINAVFEEERLAQNTGLPPNRFPSDLNATMDGFGNGWGHGHHDHYGSGNGNGLQDDPPIPEPSTGLLLGLGLTVLGINRRRARGLATSSRGEAAKFEPHSAGNL